MAEKKKASIQRIAVTAIKTAGLCVMMTLALLLGIAILIRIGVIGEDQQRLFIGGCAFLSGVLSAEIMKCGREGGFPDALTAVAALCMLLMILRCAISSARPFGASLLPSVMAAAAGIAIASIMQFNKKYKKRKRKRG